MHDQTPGPDADRYAAPPARAWDGYFAAFGDSPDDPAADDHTAYAILPDPDDDDLYDLADAGPGTAAGVAAAAPRQQLVPCPTCLASGRLDSRTRCGECGGFRVISIEVLLSANDDDADDGLDAGEAAAEFEFADREAFEADRQADWDLEAEAADARDWSQLYSL